MQPGSDARVSGSASKRRLRSLRVAALVAFALVAMGIDDCACRGFFIGSSYERKISREEAEGYLHKRYPGGRKSEVIVGEVDGHTHVTIVPPRRNGRPARRSVSASALIRYLKGKGSFRITLPGRTAAKRHLTGLLNGSFVGLGRAAVDSLPEPTSATFSGLAKLVFAGKGGGAACNAFEGSTLRASLQKAKGSFKVIGGTGRAKRLHAAGEYRAIIRNPHKQAAQATFAANPTLGSKRPMPKYCGRVPPVNPGGGGKKVKADFKGFAVSKGAPPASASVTPDGGDINSCVSGGDLWGVVSYTGPKAAKFTTETGLKGVAGEKHSYPVKAGRNALRLLDLPFENGGDPLVVSEIQVKPTGSTKLSGDTFLSPALFLQC